MTFSESKVYWRPARARFGGDPYALAKALGLHNYTPGDWVLLPLTDELKQRLRYVGTPKWTVIQKIIQARRENAPDQSGEDIQKAG